MGEERGKQKPLADKESVRKSSRKLGTTFLGEGKIRYRGCDAFTLRLRKDRAKREEGWGGSALDGEEGKRGEDDEVGIRTRPGDEGFL